VILFCCSGNFITFYVSSCFSCPECVRSGAPVFFMCLAHANVIRCTRLSDKICQLQSIVPSFPFRMYAALLDSLSRQLRNVGRCMKRDPPDSWGPPDVLHYRLADWCHPVTICYASKKSDEQLLEYRKVSRSLCGESPWFLAWKVCYNNKLKSFFPPPENSSRLVPLPGVGY